ncbi:hypothetical protein GGI05_006219 [Coemansia sp. RSA 2603]|nr:hypothetical protein GGI05_006219 [Coemansia sp. RSA 2603]
MQRIYRLTILENKPLPAPTRQGNDPFSGNVVATRRHQTSAAEYEQRRDGKNKGQSATSGGLLSAAAAAASTQTPVSTSSGSVPISANSAFANTPTGNPTSNGGSVSGGNASGTVGGGGGGSSLLLSSGHVVSSPSSQTPVTPHIRVYGDNALQRENESYKSFRISADDPCSTILPHALKKYHIFDAWHNYSLCIQYGSSSKGKSERILALDEKPLHLFQQLKDAGESPVFVLKKKNAGQGQSQSQSEVGVSPYRLSVRGNSANGGGSRTSLFSLENNNTSTSSLEIPSSKTGAAGSSIAGSIAAAGSSTNEFEKI